MHLLILSGCLTLSAQAQVSGTIFRDFNYNGVQNTPLSATAVSAGEPGLSGFVVTAYPATGSPISVTTSQTGSYSFTAAQLPSGTSVRLEFTSLTAGDFSAPVSTSTGSSRSSIQFVTAGSSAANVNFGVSYPSDYCQTNPPLVTNCYVNGSINTTTPTDVLVKMNYDGTSETSVASKTDVGSTWGIAYNRTQKLVYSAAFLKRHVGLRENSGALNPLGAIYQTDPNNATANGTLFFDLSTIDAGIGVVGTNLTRGLSLPTAPSADATVYDLVGKTGIGDIDISDDDQRLFVMSLGSRKLWSLSTSSPATSPISWDVPNPGCTNGTYRPFAVEYYRGKVYIGVVCDAQSAGTAANLRAYVYSIDPSSAGNAFTQVLTFPLNYTRSDVAGAVSGCGNNSALWRPWSATFPVTCGTTANASVVVNPQPVLSDLEFDTNGDIIIGIMDRFSHQSGNNNFNLLGTGSFDGIVAGDVLRASLSNGTYTLESNGRVGNLTGSETRNTSEGPGGREFYNDSFYSSFANNVVPHHETGLGGLTTIPGLGEIVMTAYDPVDGGVVESAGFVYLSNTNGVKRTAAYIFQNSSTNPATFGKSGGLGDIQALCNLAPVQIGNRVWLDSNNNGIQDPNETPLAGVTVTLSGPGITGSASVTTNSNGEYYFSSASGTNATGFAYGLTGLTAGSSYTLSFPTSFSTVRLSTKPDSGTGTNSDEIDTDPTATGKVVFTLGDAGENNFSYDAGYIPCSFTATASVVGSATVCQGASATLTAQVTPTDSYTYAWNAPAGITLTNGTSATVTTSGLPTGSYTFTLSVGTSPICSTTVTASIVVNPAPIPALTSATICVGQSATLTATGGSSYTFSTGLVNTTGVLVVSPANTTTYSVTVANASGCTSTTTGTVTVNLLPVPTLSSATICAGQSATLTASGGTSYTFTGGTVNTTGTLVVSPATTTTYSVTVANASGCVSTTTGTVTVNSLPTPALPSSTICSGQSATLTATGGTSYTFTGGVTNTTGTLVVSPANTTTYSVTVANASGCVSTTTGTVTVNPLPVPTLTSATICVGQSATLTATGGTSYTFTGGVTNTTGTLVVSPTNTTTYSVTVANASGCVSTTTGTVTVNLLPTVSATSATVCQGQTGTLTASGASTYRWSTGATTATISVSVAGTYSVTGTSSAGCSATATGSLTVNPLPVATLTSATICAGQSATLTATGGTSYTFTGGTVNATGTLVVSPANTTTYSVTVANANGCVSTTTGTVTVNSLPTPTLASATICVGQSATLTASGGTSYTFTGGTVNTTGTLVVSPATTTTYSVTVANASGCVSTTTGTVTVNLLPTVTATSATVCAGQSGTLTASGGSTYRWSTGATTATISVSVAGTYSVTGTSSAGCSATATGSLTVNPLPTAALTSTTICVGQSATLTASGGTSYTFTGGTVNTTGTLVVSPTTTTTYSVTVASSSGCVSTTTGTVTVNSLPSPALTSSTICAGQSATLTATGGTSYTFTGGIVNTTGKLVVSPANTTTYSVTVANASGCTSTTTGTVTVNLLPTPALSSATICAGQSATLTATGGSSYTFSTGLVNTKGLLVVSPLTTRTYSVTVANASGCVSSTTVTLTVNPSPTVSVSALAATCIGSIANSDAQIILLSSTNASRYNASLGSSFNAAAPLFVTDQTLPSVGGTLVGGQPNPAAVPGNSYTVRVYSANGCYSDIVAVIPLAACDCPPPTCVPIVIKTIRR